MQQYDRMGSEKQITEARVYRYPTYQKSTIEKRGSVKK